MKVTIFCIRCFWIFWKMLLRHWLFVIVVYYMLQFLGQRKKHEVEERRIKQKKSREEFRKMLEVCFFFQSLFEPIHIQVFLFYTCIWFCTGVKRADLIHEMEVMSSTFYVSFPFSRLLCGRGVVCFLGDLCFLMKILLNSKAESIFENDERFQAVERDRDRRDIFDSFLEELKNKVCICIAPLLFLPRFCLIDKSISFFSFFTTFSLISFNQSIRSALALFYFGLVCCVLAFCLLDILSLWKYGFLSHWKNFLKT